MKEDQHYPYRIFSNEILHLLYIFLNLFYDRY